MHNPIPNCQFDKTLTSRYECKYLLDWNTARAVQTYLKSHTQLDPFSAQSPDWRYRVMSLYLDTPSLRLYRDTENGVRNRYKLRLRYYEEEGDGPVFFEVKKRADIIVRKNRERVTRVQADAFLRHGSCLRESCNGEDYDEFIRRCQESGAMPALRLRYWREAWESRSIDPVRITFDTEVEHCVLSDRELLETRPVWTKTPIAAPVILEVKFTDLRPHWLTMMLQRFNLGKVSVAKYAESIEDLLATGEIVKLRARMGHTSHNLRVGNTPPLRAIL